MAALGFKVLARATLEATCLVTEHPDVCKHQVIRKTDSNKITLLLFVFITLCYMSTKAFRLPAMHVVGFLYVSSLGSIIVSMC